MGARSPTFIGPGSAAAGQRKNNIIKPVNAITIPTPQHSGTICYKDQGIVWKHRKPTLIILGSGQGLTNEVVEQSGGMVSQAEHSVYVGDEVIVLTKRD